MNKELKVNPMTELRFNGEYVLRMKLNELELKDLQFIVSEHSYDPFKLLTKNQKNNKEHLINFLVERAATLIKLGRVFRQTEPKDR